MHVEAERFLSHVFGRACFDSVAGLGRTHPAMAGYVSQPFRVLRIEDFSPPQIDVAVKGRGYYDAVLVFSTKYQPAHPLLENWVWWQRLKEKFFGYHRDLLPEEIAQRVGGTITYHDERDGQWVAVIAVRR